MAPVPDMNMEKKNLKSFGVHNTQPGELGCTKKKSQSKSLIKSNRVGLIGKLEHDVLQFNYFDCIVGWLGRPSITVLNCVVLTLNRAELHGQFDFARGRNFKWGWGYE